MLKYSVLQLSLSVIMDCELFVTFIREMFFSLMIVCLAEKAGFYFCGGMCALCL